MAGSFAGVQREAKAYLAFQDDVDFRYCLILVRDFFVLDSLTLSKVSVVHVLAQLVKIVGG